MHPHDNPLVTELLANLNKKLEGKLFPPTEVATIFLQQCIASVNNLREDAQHALEHSDLNTIELILEMSRFSPPEKLREQEAAFAVAFANYMRERIAQIPVNKLVEILVLHSAGGFREAIVNYQRMLMAELMETPANVDGKIAILDRHTVKLTEQVEYLKTL